ncbi:hypothetical protein BpHYR1_037893 [Brachionus plicatilis]|uniref:RNA-directed DNA polymerase from mobile element jockey-like n=1 Tax=Brachionus plicatilis TaxID=10195 RepID=A0A3M7QNM4_BRAPC|nr:hypothetical protein BpHYR1_037893 [Brachionus plicatilis]
MSISKYFGCLFPVITPKKRTHQQVNYFEGENNFRKLFKNTSNFKTDNCETINKSNSEECVGPSTSGYATRSSSNRKINSLNCNKFWKLKKDTLLNIYKTLIGSVIDYKLIKDYVGAFVNSSRICSNKTPLCGIWIEINEWMIERGCQKLS